MSSSSEHWEEYHKQWDKGMEVPSNPRIIEAIFSTLDIKNKKVLEVGSGIGRDSIYLAKSGAENYLLDYVDAPFKIAHEIARREKVKIITIKGDAQNLPFPDDHFDLVFSGGLIEHFLDPSILIKEQRRVLKKGGYLLVDVPQRYHVFTLIKHVLMIFNKWAPGGETEYSIGQLERLIKGCGLSLECVYGDWSHPNFFLKMLLIMLKVPRKHPKLDFSSTSKGCMARFKKTRMACYTFQHIGVVARKTDC